MFCFQHCQNDRANLTEDDIKRGTKTKEKDELQKAYMVKKIPLKQCGSVVVGMDIKTTYTLKIKLELFFNSEDSFLQITISKHKR